jgi:hypothetical protein
MNTALIIDECLFVDGEPYRGIVYVSEAGILTIEFPEYAIESLIELNKEETLALFKLIEKAKSGNRYSIWL